MTRLPLELQQAVVHWQDVGGPLDVINLRLVSKDLIFIAPPLAFRYTRETSGVARRTALMNVFSRLTKFCNLRKLRFDFHGTYEEDELSYNDAPTHYFLLQNAIFADLALNPPPVVSLTLNNVIAKPDDIYTQERFHRVFESLQELSISVLSDVGLEAGHGNEDLCAFWEQNAMHMPVGSPETSFEDIDLPHLSSLVLHHFALQPSTDRVEFILRHKDTLTRLELHKCSIDGGWRDEDGFDELFPCPWHAVFASFEEELSALRYTRDDEGRGYVLWDEAAEAVGELDGRAQRR
ncbi:hypothetical protein C8R45DRAFT_1072747 [Mycena sanguinolenta]|nr:hypothetical protein C8R45DRAFT_1072747 [Mycena sanguinolenta]